MSGVSSPSPARRDRDVRRVRGAAWAAGAAAAALAAGLSVAAAHAFKGHDGTAAASAPVPAARSGRVRVPPAQHVPAIAGDPAPLQAPAAAPTAAPPQPAPQPETSGGS
jgi:hypothetical protein